MMSNNWSWYVIILVVLNILAMVWLLFSTSKSNDIDDSSTTGHSWDGIEELNTPLPRWWLWLFVITIVFSVVYLYLYPGLGNYAGSLNWSQMGQYEESKIENLEQQATFFADYADLEVSQLAENETAMETGQRLFLNNCATCHGSDGHGAKGFPRLTDDDWLFGGTPEAIVQTITNGRAGLMPDLLLPEANVVVLARYSQYLAGQEVSEHVKERGEALYAVCSACHGVDGKGNQILGAPNLTDDIWLYGSNATEIENLLRDGKQGNMPSFSTLLSEQQIELLAAYVLSISDE